MPGYNYASEDDVRRDETVEEAVRTTVVNYFFQQLGWSREKCEERVEKELNRDIPKRLFDKVREEHDWHLSNAQLIDVGAGQGGGVLEALDRGADAHGVEPGPEFAALAERRLEAEGYDTGRIHRSGGEDLPFPDEIFDYAISLQVLEHVEDPRPLLEEMYRVLKPGGEAVVRCENYLAFREQHYRVPWLPLLPKSIGSLYLRAMGRDPSFLRDYVFYTTYPQIYRLAMEVGFKEVNHEERLRKAEKLQGMEMGTSKVVAKLLKPFSPSVRRKVALMGIQMKKSFTIGIGLHLKKCS